MDSDFHPRLRALEAQWIEREGQPALLLLDRLAIGARAVVVPQLLAPLLALCDGTRDLPTLRSAYELQTGIRLDPSVVETAVSQLDEARMLEGGRFVEAYRQALEGYRSSPFRPAALAGGGYPAEAAQLAELLEGYLGEAVAQRDGQTRPAGRLRGVVCPHIDYDRGGLIYAQLWDRVREALAEVDLFIVLGTDHAGGAADLTLTRQSYHTPFGLLPTDVDAVEAVAESMGHEAAFGSELNHRVEHSVELAAVWLRYLAGDRDVRMVPVLCGSFYPFTQGDRRPDQEERWQAGAQALSRIAQGDRTLVVAAADLAHMGPAFGDRRPMGPVEQTELATSDAAMLGTICRGDEEGFLDLLAGERDRRRICGLPPIYLALRILGDVVGETTSYSICPAPGESVVSVAGVTLSNPS